MYLYQMTPNYNYYEFVCSQETAEITCTTKYELLFGSVNVFHSYCTVRNKVYFPLVLRLCIFFSMFESVSIWVWQLNRYIKSYCTTAIQANFFFFHRETSQVSRYTFFPCTEGSLTRNIHTTEDKTLQIFISRHPLKLRADVCSSL